MSLILRKIDDTIPWQDIDDDNVDQISSEPPLWAVRMFIPSIKDKGSISFFEVDDRSEAQALGSAMHFSFSELGKKPISFVGVHKEILIDAGFEIENSPGNINHRLDTKHRGISPATINESIQLASLFLRGNIEHFEGRALLDRAVKEARNDQFDFTKLATTLQIPAVGIKNTMKFIKDGIIVPRGNPMP